MFRQKLVGGKCMEVKNGSLLLHWDTGPNEAAGLQGHKVLKGRTGCRRALIQA